MPLYSARLKTGKNILNLTEHFQFSPCQFLLFTTSCNFRFELRLGIFWYFLEKNGFWNKMASIITVSPVTFGDMALWIFGTQIWSGGFR
jgi:hypothetical protein